MWLTDEPYCYGRYRHEVGSNGVQATPTRLAFYSAWLCDDVTNALFHLSNFYISELRCYLPQSSLTILYFSLVHIHLLYALPVWASTYNTYLTKLKRLQNKAVRIISRTSIKDKITPNYNRLEILKLDDLCTLEIAKMMYQFTQNKLPDLFDHYFTYSSDVSKHYTRHVSQEDHIVLNRYATSRTQHTVL